MRCSKILTNTFLQCAIGASLLLALPVFSHAKSITLMEERSVDIDKPVSVAGKVLPAGSYDLLIEGNQASFEQAGRTLATAPCEREQTKSETRYDSVQTSNKDVLKEIQFGGTNEALKIK